MRVKFMSPVFMIFLRALLLVLHWKDRIPLSSSCKISSTRDQRSAITGWQYWRVAPYHKIRYSAQCHQVKLIRELHISWIILSGTNIATPQIAEHNNYGGKNMMFMRGESRNVGSSRDCRCSGNKGKWARVTSNKHSTNVLISPNAVTSHKHVP
jgi:hypothetical protein